MSTIPQHDLAAAIEWMRERERCAPALYLLSAAANGKAPAHLRKFDFPSNYRALAACEKLLILFPTFRMPGFTALRRAKGPWALLVKDWNELLRILRRPTRETRKEVDRRLLEIRRTHWKNL